MVTDEQVRRLRKLSNTEKNQEIAASKAGMDPTTARRYLGLERLPSELKKERPWRTLQRRIKLWRVTEGPAQEVYFGQKHTPGRLCASDFTHMTELGITLGGQTFEHLVSHFVLTYSKIAEFSQVFPPANHRRTRFAPGN